MDDTILYFAYGSNLDPERATSRGLDVATARRAALRGYRFAFNKRANGGGVYGNVMPAPGQTTWGAVFISNETQLQGLDRHEGAPKHYRRALLPVVLDDGSELQAVAYVATKEYIVPDGRPDDKYLQYILDGAQFHALPDDHIDFIRRLSGNDRAF